MGVKGKKERGRSSRTPGKKLETNIKTLSCRKELFYMKRSIWIAILIFFNILVIGGFIIWYCSRTYPMIGHDYKLFMPYMIDSFLHQKINGLTIQWYTPSFAGGRPVFPFPQDFQFSLPQFLLWIVNPWIANLVSIMIYLTIGFIATFYFLKQLVELQSTASILGAVFFSANGFYFNHIAVGHLTFQVFPLFAVIIVIITHPRLPGWLGGLLLSFICAIVLYSGIHNAFFFTLSGILVLPIIYLVRPSLLNGKRLLALALWGGSLTLLLCGSKLSAVLFLMRFFPRTAQDSYNTSLWTGVVGMIQQLLGTMTMGPIYRLSGNPFGFIPALEQITGTPYGIWELDASMSPALLLLLAGGAMAFLLRKPNGRAPLIRKRLIAEVCLILALWLVIEFTLAKGIIFPLIRDFPIIKSFRVNCRYISAFIFPLSMVGAVIFNNWTKNWLSNKKIWSVFLTLNGIALVSLWFFHYLPTQELVLNGDVRSILNTYEKIRYGGETFPVQYIVPDADPWAVFEENATSLDDPYNTFLKGVNVYRKILHAGSVYDVDHGYFNIIDPTGYVFPEVNNSKLYERIPVTDRDKFLDFINRRQPKWMLPLSQQIFNWVSLFTLIAEFGALLLYFLGKCVRIPGLKSR
jgi:hypothetical protein